MEQFQRTRLELRKQRLQGHLDEAQDLLQRYRDGTEITQQDLVRSHAILKQSVGCIKTDLDKYATTESADMDLMNLVLEHQLQAEDILVELDTLIKIMPKAQEEKECTPSRTSMKLPKLDLLKFNGDILKYTEFWDIFEANIHSQNIKPVEKLAYLLSSLEGKAKESLEGISITNDNYPVALGILKDRYGMKNKVIDSHFEALSKLNRSGNTADGCRQNLNEINKHLRVLASLGEDQESNHLRSLITSKFPDKVLYELNLLTADNQSVSTIRSTLETIVGAMERAQTQFEAPVPTSSTEAFHVTTRRPTFHRGKPKQNPARSQQETTNRKRTASRTFMTAKRSKRSCIFCDSDHFNDECTVVKTLEDRRKKLQGRCFLCLKEGHRAVKCTYPKKCYHCKGKHNRALCPTRAPPGKNSSHASSINLMGQTPKTGMKSFLQVATAQVSHNNKIIDCRLLLDSGSSRSYITSRLAKHLDLTNDDKDVLLIYTFGAEKPKELVSPCSDIVIQTKRGVEKKIHVNVVPHITDRIPKPDIPTTNMVDILADDCSKGKLGIDMLIGNDYYFSFMRNNTLQVDKDLFLVDTDFGWVISGHLDMDRQQEEQALTVTTYHQGSKECSCYTEPDLPLRQSDIKFLWSLENIGITDSVKATREDEAVQHFNDTVVYEGGRYHVKWPWTAYPPQLPTNYGLAYGRLKGLIQRLDKPTLQEYNEILMEQLKVEIIEVVHVDKEVSLQTVPPKHYLPHHIVKQSGKRGRVVYDASARIKDELSLNECLYRGPCMLQDLTALLLNFRTHKIGIVADVEKAFLQVGLQEEDRDVTRFLWIKDINKPISNENLLHLRFTRVPFGIVSSPFLLSATIRHHISQKNSELLKGVADKCYVDNLVTGTNTTSDAVQLFKETRAVFEELSMNLRDWTSNDEAFVQTVPESCRAKEANKIKVLGLLWDKQEDTLSLNMNPEILTEDNLEKITKREVLRTLASVYDPCGIVSPVLMPIKLFLQELWLNDYKWDTPISHELLLKWKDLKQELHKINGVKIPRHVETDIHTEYEIHCFTDAAKDSYAAVAYLRCDNGSNVTTAYLMSKNRIVPLERDKKSGNKDKKKLTIPQLELLGCVIGNRLLTYLKENLELHITKQYLWTDSLVALSWIQSNKLLPPFIANRVAEIKRNSSTETCYVNTLDNPADIATRPELWTQKQNIWLKGPAFLAKNKDKWPKDRELKSHHNLSSVSAVVDGLEEQFPDNIPLDMPEEDEQNHNQNQVCSQVLKIKALQEQYYPEETRGKQTSLSRNLDLFTDVDGLLRCKGRMTHANWSYDMKYPILLPRGCDFTDKLIKETHESNYHVGAPHTLSLIRRQYWIPRGRPVVEKVIRRCPQCVKQGGGPYSLPPPPALPAERTNYSSAFTYTGMDYFGPVYVDTENGQQKRWVCLLTCLAVRAIHMEIVKNLTAEECMMALRRFMSTRGVPSVIVSDNALYFKLCSDVLQSEHCTKNNIKWKFIPQLAPWHGAFYERLVGLVKSCMKRTLEKQLLNDTQVFTVIKEIEAVVNSRPLTRVGPDMDAILRPCDFLSLGNCLNLEVTDASSSEPSLVKQSLLEGWKRGQNMLNEFKNMFINQYLMSLRERYQHSYKQPRVKAHKEPKVGDLVQIKGESKNRNTWKVGKIINLIRSIDGQTRVAQVKVGNITFTRSIAHLYPLELEEPLTPQPEVMEPMDVDTPEEFVQSEPRVIQLHELPDITVQKEQTEATTEEQQVPPEIPETSTTRVIEGEDSVDVGPEEELPNLSSPVSDEVCDTSPHIDEGMEVQSKSPPREEVVKRAAAIRARERIAEWTSQLFTTL